MLPILASLTLTPALAFGDAASAAQGKERFLAGAQAYREGRYRDAIDLFRQANTLDPHPEMLFNIGQGYEKLGEYANALSAYRQYLRFSPAAPDRPNVEATIRNLEQRLQERGLQQVTVLSTPAGARLDLDGKSVGQTPWTGEIASGKHIFVLHAAGYPDVAKEVELAGGRAVDLDVVMGPAIAGLAAAPVAAGPPALPPPVVVGSGAPTPAPPSPAPPSPEGPHKRSVSVLTGVLLGVGLAGFGTAIGLEVARANANSDAQNDKTQVGYANSLSSMTTYQTAARVTVGLASAVTAAGVILLVIDVGQPAARTAEPSPARVGMSLGGACFGGGGGLVGQGKF
jgi:tetratricopeptide (TPR) repeat protein